MSFQLPTSLSRISTLRDGAFRLFVRLFAAELAHTIYRGVLARPPDATGLDAYTDEIRRTRDLSTIVGDVIRSEEFRRKFLTTLAPDLVRAAFHGLLEREAEPSVLASHVEALVHSRNFGELIAELTRSTEFRSKSFAKLAPELVRAAFHGLLEREAEPSDLASHAEALVHSRNFGELIAELTRSTEFRSKSFAKLAPELVRSIFQVALRRNAEPQAVAYYSRQLTENTDIGRTLAEILASEEYRKRIFADIAPALVNGMFKGLLEREAEPKAVDAYAESLASKQDIGAVLAELVRSQEFYSKFWAKRVVQFSHPSTAYEVPTVVFLHAQKTAGTSLRNMLRSSYGNDRVFSEHDDTLHLWCPAELSKYTVFAGHFNYDSLAYIHRRKQSVFTFVRDPKNRLLSLFDFWRAHEPSHPSYHGDMVLANEASAEEFFSRAEAMTNPTLWNHLAWTIMGDRQWQVWRSALADATDERAATAVLRKKIRPAVRQRLREFAFVGFQEDFSRSVELLFKVLERPQPELRADHSLERLTAVAPSFKRRVEKCRLTPELDAILDGLVQIDNIVFEESKEMYEELLTTHGSEDGLAIAVRAAIAGPR